MPKINIITQLTVFFVFAISLNVLNLNTLLIIFVMLLVVLSSVKLNRFYQLSKRLKWFYLVMFMIFAFNTPGEHLSGWSLSISPTYEGLREGLMQLLRINVMLAALSLLLAVNSRKQLISGFHFLLSPLKYLKLNTEIFAARLWLTLHYVEAAQKEARDKRVFSNLGEILSNIFADTQYDDVVIVLDKPKFSWVDFCLIGLVLTLLEQVLFKVGF